MATKTEIGILHASNASRAEPIEYPAEDGEPMAGDLIHHDSVHDMYAYLRTRFAGISDVFVAWDMFVYYRMGDPGSRLAPNVFVVFGSTRRQDERKGSWRNWEHGGAPSFVLEVAAEGTWERDATFKRDVYAATGVTEYWRFDPAGEFFATESADGRRLIGERLVEGRYEPIPLSYDTDEVTLRGHSEVLGVDICTRLTENGMARILLYDLTTGEYSRNLDEAEARADAEAEARRGAEAENERLRHELARLRGGGSSD